MQKAGDPRSMKAMASFAARQAIVLVLSKEAHGYTAKFDIGLRTA